MCNTCNKSITDQQFLTNIPMMIELPFHKVMSCIPAKTVHFTARSSLTACPELLRQQNMHFQDNEAKRFRTSTRTVGLPKLSRSSRRLSTFRLKHNKINAKNASEQKVVVRARETINLVVFSN